MKLILNKYNGVGGMDWFKLAEDNSKRLAVVKKVMNIRVK